MKTAEQWQGPIVSWAFAEFTEVYENESEFNKMIGRLLERQPCPSVNR